MGLIGQTKSSSFRYIALDQVQIGQYPPSSNFVRTSSSDRTSWLLKRAHFHGPFARPCSRQCRFLSDMGFCYSPRSCTYVRTMSCQMIELSMQRCQLLVCASASHPLLARYMPISDISLLDCRVSFPKHYSKCFCRSQTSSKVYAHQYNGTEHARRIIAQA